MGKGDAATSTAAAGAKSEPEAIDVSIPYNAAARIAFKQTKLAESKFQEFESLYLQKTVAEVTAKKMKRDVAEFEKGVAKLAKDLESFA